MQTYWGIDLGGTKIEGVILSSPSPEAVVYRHRIDTQADKGYYHILDRIVELVSILKAETGYIPNEVGVGTPGTVDPLTGLMKNCNTTCLNDMPLPADLQKALGVPVVIANDANCFALAEAQMGIVQDIVPNYRLVFGIIMGTGVGGGVVIRGNDQQAFVLNGAQGIGGEWGHNVLEENGYPCFCGKSGCVEQVLSGPALQRFYQDQSGVFRKLPDILSRHVEGNDMHATATVERMLEKFGQAITTLVNVLDPDAIVVGGGVGNVDLLYQEGPVRANRYVFNSSFNTPILRPKLGDSAGVFGAAMLTFR